MHSTSLRSVAYCPFHCGVQKKKKGRPPVSLDIILQALLFRLREGCCWRARSIFAPHTTIYTRWKQWCKEGLWDRILESLSTSAQGRLWSIDSTSAKVHKHACGGGDSPENQAIGKSRGGSKTKIHALVDTYGRAVRLILTPGNRNDIVNAPDLVTDCTQQTILADKAYDSDDFRSLLKDLGLTACIPPKANRTDPASYHKPTTSADTWSRTSFNASKKNAPSPRDSKKSLHDFWLWLPWPLSVIGCVEAFSNTP